MLPQPLYRTIDMHTAGEPVRIICEGYPDLAGATLLDKRRDALTRFDHIRRALMLEPRGHAGMYGVIPVAPSHPNADLAVLFTHNEGYSTMCGHATIAIGRWAVDTGRVRAIDGRAAFKLETPCGLVRVEVEIGPGAAPLVSFESVPAFVSHPDRAVDVPGFGRVHFDIAFGGAYYAILPSSRIGLTFESTALPQLVAAGVGITEAVREAIPIVHPDAPDLGFLYGTILTDDAESGAPTSNLCVFAEGQIDRSPTGSGVTARMALDFARGGTAIGQARVFRGISGQAFSGTLVSAERVKVSGRAFYTSRAAFICEADDDFAEGFALATRFGDLG